MKIIIPGVISLSMRDGFPPLEEEEMPWQMEFSRKLSDLVHDAWTKGVMISIEYREVDE